MYFSIVINLKITFVPGNRTAAQIRHGPAFYLPALVLNRNEAVPQILLTAPGTEGKAHESASLDAPAAKPGGDQPRVLSDKFCG
jgi:hypothetical protein